VMYTTNVLRKKPSPIPLMARPTKSMGRATEAHSIAAPMPKMNEPVAVAARRPA
jgi:hypothetical protein